MFMILVVDSGRDEKIVFKMNVKPYSTVALNTDQVKALEYLVHYRMYQG